MERNVANQEVKLNVKVVPTDPLPTPIHVGFVLVDQVGNEVELTLCDVNLRELRESLQKARTEQESSETLETEIVVRSLQRVYLSRSAIANLLDSLRMAVATMEGQK